jgi:hypothetical protein
LATRWTEKLYETENHVLGRPLWSDQVGFTLGLAELRLAPDQFGFFKGAEVADWARARRMSSRPTIVHFGGQRWRRLWSQGRILGLIR